MKTGLKGLRMCVGHPVVAYREARGRRKPAGFPHARHLRQEFAISPPVKPVAFSGSI